MTAEDVSFWVGLGVGLIPLHGWHAVDVPGSFSGGGGYPEPPNTCFGQATQSAAAFFFELSQPPLPMAPRWDPRALASGDSGQQSPLPRGFGLHVASASRSSTSVGFAALAGGAARGQLLFSLWLERAGWVMPAELCAGQAEGDVGSAGGWDPENSLFLSAPGSMKHLSLPPDVRCVYSC